MSRPGEYRNLLMHIFVFMKTSADVCNICHLWTHLLSNTSHLRATKMWLIIIECHLWIIIACGDNMLR